MGIRIPDFFKGGVVTHLRTQKDYIVLELRDNGDVRVRIAAWDKKPDGIYTQQGWWTDRKDFT